MSLTSRQKDLIRNELSGERGTLLHEIKWLINDKLWDLNLDDEDILSLSRMWELFNSLCCSIADPEIDDIIFNFEEDVINVWETIRHGLRKGFVSDLEFDKKAICQEIDEAVKEYLKKLEEE